MVRGRRSGQAQCKAGMEPSEEKNAAEGEQYRGQKGLTIFGVRERSIASNARLSEPTRRAPRPTKERSHESQQILLDEFARGGQKNLPKNQVIYLFICIICN